MSDECSQSAHWIGGWVSLGPSGHSGIKEKKSHSELLGTEF